MPSQEQYDLPPDPTGLTSEEAEVAMSNMTAASVRDESHPLRDGGHLLHRHFSDYHGKLAEIVATDRNARQEAADAEQVEKLLAGEAGAQKALRDEATEEMAKLKALGYEEAPIPPDIRPDQVLLLKYERLAAEGSLDELGGLVAKEFSELRAPAAVTELFQNFRHAADLDPDLRTGIFQEVLDWLRRAHVERYGTATKPPIDGADVE